MTAFPCGTLAEAIETSEGAPSALRSHRERDDAYAGVVVYLGDGRRVIRCKDDSQWILQRNGAGRSRRAEWRGEGYFLTRAALIRLSALYASPTALEIFSTLPERYERGRI